MYRVFFLFFLLLLAGHETHAADTAPHKGGQLIVMMKAGYTIQTALEKNARCNGVPTQLITLQRLAKTSHTWLLQFDSLHIDEEALLQQVQRTDEVALAQFNHYIHQRGVPDDTNFGSQYALNNTGQSGGTPDADIDAPEAWDVTTSGLTALGDTIVVAVIDAGFQVTHPDLGFWKNYHEIAGNGIDDDGNGYVDDVNGWNVFLHNNTIVNDQHGTHVAGIIGAKGNNNLGITGVSWNVKLMPVVGATTNESQAVEAYDYVMHCRRLYNVTNGAKGAYVVATNSSFGVDHGLASNFPIWCAYYDSLGMEGIISAGATANNNWNVDAVGDIPTTCPSDFFIGVSSSDRNDAKVSASGYGVQNIDLVAPGATILSTYPTSTYANMTGTSMASPHVAGAVALMYAAACSQFLTFYRQLPGNIAQDMRNVIIGTVDHKPGFDTLYASGGRLNLRSALDSLQDYYGGCATGIRTVELSSIAELYPNPAGSLVTLEFSHLSSDALVEIRDLAGRLLMQTPVSGVQALKMNIDYLEEGIYFIRLVPPTGKAPDGSRALKLIKTRE